MTSRLEHSDADSGRRLGVVVVEPVPEVLDKIRAVLSKYSDVEILIEALGADQALGEMRQIRHRTGVVAVVSMTLSGEHDAVWLIRAVRRNYPTFPVIACGLTTDSDTISYALFAGADGFVGLGVRASQFVDALRGAASRGGPDGGSGGPLIVVPGEEPAPHFPVPLEAVEPEPPAGPSVPEVETAVTTAAEPQPGHGIADRLTRLFGGRRRREAAPAPAPEPERRVAPPPALRPRPEPAPRPESRAVAPQARVAPPEARVAPPEARVAPPEARVAPPETRVAPPEQAPTPLQPSPPEVTAPPETEATAEPEVSPAPRQPEAEPEAEQVPEVTAEAVPTLEPGPPAEAVPAVEAEPAAEAEAAPEPLLLEETALVEVAEEPEEPEAETPGELEEVESEGDEPAHPEPSRAEIDQELLESIPAVPGLVEREPVEVGTETGAEPLGVRTVAVGPPQGFRELVATALGVEPPGVEWVPSATQAEELLIHSDPPVEILVVAPRVKEPDAFGLADVAMRTSPATTVIFAREGDRERIASRAMRAGVRDVVELSLGVDDLKDALERALDWALSMRTSRRAHRTLEEGALGRVVSIFASKGGTGKTFLAANLAVAIADRSGEDVAVFDLDFTMGDVFAFFGQEPDRSFQELLGVGELTDANDIRSAGTKLTDRVWGYAARPEHDASPGSLEIGKLLHALRLAFPHVVVDASTDYSDRALAVFDVSAAICLVTGLDIVGARHLSVDLETLRRLHLSREKLRVILNRADAKVGLDQAAIERALKIAVDAAIPSSSLVPGSVNRGRPLYLDDPDSAVAKRIAALADKLIAPREEANTGRKRLRPR